MNPDSNAILTLCSHLCVGNGVHPLEPKEYSSLARILSQLGKSPKDLFDFSTDDFRAMLGCDDEGVSRLMRLLDRNASLGFELAQYRNMGIETLTRADAKYPKILKKKLSHGCPPLFYYAGDLSLLEKKLVGFVGSRAVAQEDVDFTVRSVRKTVALGCGVVSGGAKGIDTVAGTEALLNDGFSVEYLSDSLLRKLRKSEIIKNIQQGNLLLMSVSKPDAGFNIGTAMMRNRYIYAQSIGTVIVRSDLNKGGTWTGATENLSKNWCTTLCWDHMYPGNQELIKMGAIPIDDNWDGVIYEHTTNSASEEKYEQTSLFDII